MNSLEILLSQISETYMLLMDYPWIRGEEIPDYAKKATWNLLHAYIDAHSQILIDKFTGYGVQAILRLKYQYTNMKFADQNRYNIMFQQVIQKRRGGSNQLY